MITTTESALRRASLSTAETEAVIRDLIRQRDAAICMSIMVATNLMGLKEPVAIIRGAESFSAWLSWDVDPERERIAAAVMRATGLEANGETP